MLGIILLIVFAVLHFAACGAWLFRGPVSIKDNIILLPMILCLPVVGLLCAWRSAGKTVEEEMETPVSQLYKTVERDVLSVNAGRPELDTVVPFDEVLLLSNDKDRREVMMHILRRDPFAYLEMLKTAKVSSDVEITHYATTTIMEIQRDLDINMQHTEAAFNLQPDNLDTVNRFINALSSYINTGLLLENRMLQLRHQLSQILEHKLSIFPNSRSAHLLLVNNEISLGNYTRAAEVAVLMRAKWPLDETSWLISLRVCMIAGDAKEKADIAAQMITIPVIWSRAGREESVFLCGY
ncbi:MAG: hypothetical protein FWF22_04165 [Treponema sp.]|nr:hypothetical protein [Treponema sp.]